MSIGSALQDAYAAASDEAKQAARGALASAKSAEASSANGLAKITDVAITGVGEVANLSLAVTKVAYASAYKIVTAPYRMAEKLFSDKLPAGKSAVQPCRLRDKERVFTSEYRRELIGLEFAGAGNPSLRGAMTELRADDPKDVDRHLATIARYRDRPLREVEQEYDKYRELRQAQLDKIDNSKGKLESIDELKSSQSDFMGSNWQLRYGKVVGERLNIDPTFAAMLNPTGGLVGPGNQGWRPDGAFMPESVAYHGAYHDAMGYLLNYQQQGPGYNYMESQFGFAKDNPLAGQSTGIAPWYLDLSK